MTMKILRNRNSPKRFLLCLLLFLQFHVQGFLISSRRSERRWRNTCTWQDRFDLLPGQHSLSVDRTTVSATKRSQDEPISVEEDFERISNYFDGRSVEDIQKYLAKLGVSFVESIDGTESTHTSGKSSEILKVPGCIANVHVQVCIKDDCVTSIKGTSDAILSRGLLALTVQLLQGKQVEAVLNLTPEKMTDQLGLRSALSPGRNDGIASLCRTIQKLIRNVVGMESPALPAGSFSRESKPNKPTVALLLSGGVDSSVALRLLLQQGYDVTAYYLKIWLQDELSHLGECPWEDDYKMCQAVCTQAGVPLESISLQQEYHARVIEHTVQEASKGRTPNPDILCNSRVKFGCFYDALLGTDFDYIATGHYAQLQRDEQNCVHLIRAPDPVKDQSYFLCALSQEQIQKVLFPIGHLQKSAVRQLADEFDLPNRHRPDSQGLCFLGKVKFDAFLAAYLGERPGQIIDASTGETLGQHRGVWFHTVGQRKGIGKVLDPLATSRGPWYVVAKDPARDLVFCSNQYDQDVFEASRSEFTVEDIHWIANQPPQHFQHNDNLRLTMKIRHGPKIVDGTLTLLPGSKTGDVKLDNKDSGLAPGQYVVFYQDEECLGCGIISEKHWARFLLDREEDAVVNTK